MSNTLRPYFTAVFCFVAAVTLPNAGTAQSNTASQFLGPHRNGVLPVTSLLDQWPAAGPAVAWRAPGGVGMSGVSVAEGVALTLWNSQDGQVLAALKLEDGSAKWTTRLAANYENGMGNGNRIKDTASIFEVARYDSHILAG